MLGKNVVKLTITTFFFSTLNLALSKLTPACSGSSGLKYLWGDAMVDSPDCVGPNEMPYPTAAIDRNFKASKLWLGNFRTGRSQNTIDPFITRNVLLSAHQQAFNDQPQMILRHSRATNLPQSNMCGSTPPRLCKTRYNTTAPMYGVSLTSGQPVTIVQKFPDLLQQVVFEVCESSECDVVRGECTQTYVPYLFLVIPLGPVTLTGQDYVLVESGCVCRPKYAGQNNAEAANIPAIPRI
ncbi:uncharacterized protein LOC130901538 isoform X1 [Diorhabda carinulata]|uniref:uncharacterized protein LOC130901538 isoform X1 n=1 Tax=Diorhabda carinulata TaxID=1163345 RepID=UPI0025A2B4DD|nr:uncharacterized protein LOC130901538 isoform X1 [Diorhabda carinulata]